MSCLLGTYQSIVGTAQLIVLCGYVNCLEITSFLANLDFVHATLRAFPKADPFGGLHHVAVVEGEI